MFILDDQIYVQQQLFIKRLILKIICHFLGIINFYENA
jgi:hypothetical protein